jgi:RNA polymerase sigma-70 factor, ECF subfamily
MQAVSNIKEIGVASAELSFVEIYRRHFNDVTRWARALGGPEADLEDVTQEVFIVVRRKLESFDGLHLKAWLYQITAYTVSDCRRRAWFRNVFFRSTELEPELMPTSGEDPSAAAERKESQRILFSLANKIHRSRRDTFLLFELEGLSGEEIAELQGVPVATVWTRLHLARKEFMAAAAEFRRQETK